MKQSIKSKRPEWQPGGMCYEFFLKRKQKISIKERLDLIERKEKETGIWSGSWNPKNPIYLKDLPEKLWFKDQINKNMMESAKKFEHLVLFAAENPTKVRQIEKLAARIGKTVDDELYYIHNFTDDVTIKNAKL